MFDSPSVNLGKVLAVGVPVLFVGCIVCCISSVFVIFVNVSGNEVLSQIVRSCNISNVSAALDEIQIFKNEVFFFARNAINFLCARLRPSF